MASEQTINSFESLSIKIDRDTPISLDDLTIGLNSISYLYSNFTKGNKNAKLLVKEVNKSSILLTLISNVNSIAPLVSGLADATNLLQFCQYLELLKDICIALKNDSSIPSNVTKNNILSFKKNCQLIKNTNDSLLYTVNAPNNQGNIEVNINGGESKKIDENVSLFFKDDKDDKIKLKQLFTWVQINFEKTNTGNKGLIENIYPKPLKVTFEEESIKKEMMSGDNWQNMGYIVDVEVQIMNNEPMVYKVLKNYQNDMFSLAE